MEIPENRELRAAAREQLKGRWGNPILAGVVYFVLVGLGSAIPYAGFVVSIVIGGPMILGFTHFFVKFAREEETRLEDLFKGFDRFGSALILHILVCVFVFLWTLLLVVPGIVAGLRYSMSFYIMNDEPGIGGKEALERSKAAMDGYKMKLFLLDLSFLGWTLLCIPTLGIGFLWLAPYWKLARVHFYERVVRERAFPVPPPAGNDPIMDPSLP